MVSEKETNQKEQTDAGRLLSLLRPAVKQLAELHRSGKVHGAIGPESVVIRDHIWFCFPLPEKAARAYTTEQKAFVSLEEPGENTDGQAPFCVPLEQLFAAVPVNPGTDAYSMCAVLYQKLTGAEPADVGSRLAGAELKKPSELGVRITKQQEAALMKGLSLLGQDRYADAIQLYQELYGYEGEKETEKNAASETDVKEKEKEPRKADEGKGDEPERTETSTPAAKPGGTLREGWKVTDDVKTIGQLRSITFMDSISQEAAGKWDVSEKRDGSVMAWLKKTGNGEEKGYELYIGAEGGVRAARNSQGLFMNCAAAERIFFGGNFDTAQVTNMKHMFSFCRSLTELDVSSFDTAHVTNMEAMFSGCGRLKELDVSGFDTSQVTRMADMFARCVSLTRLDVSGFDTSRTEDMSGMFYDCTSLEELDISHFDRSAVEEDRDMLTGTRWEELEEEEQSDWEEWLEQEWPRDNSGETVKESGQEPNRTGGRKKGGMLREGLRIRHELWNRERTYGGTILEKLRAVTFLDRIPESGEKTSREEGRWDISQNMDGSVMAMLKKQGAGEYYELYIGAEGGVQAAADSRSLFADCQCLEQISFNGNFDTSRAVSLEQMFRGCKKLRSLDASGFDTSHVTGMAGMFHGCESLTELDVSGFDTSKVTSMSSMFQDCKNLVHLNVRGFDTSAVASMAFMFSGCKKLSELDMSGFNTSKVTRISYMFDGCSSLKNLDLSGFDMSRVKNQDKMLQGTKGGWQRALRRLFRP